MNGRRGKPSFREILETRENALDAVNIWLSKPSYVKCLKISRKIPLYEWLNDFFGVHITYRGEALLRGENCSKLFVWVNHFPILLHAIIQLRFQYMPLLFPVSNKLIPRKCEVNPNNALSLDKIGCGSAKKKKILWLFFSLCTHLALSLDKIGCGSE